MKAYSQEGMVTMYQGDCREILRELPDESVHCCVTSPPYWGLRDYGTAEWQGGDAECNHRQGRPGAGRADGVVDERFQRNRDGAGSMGGDCQKCGAKRVDSQIGLEKTPEEYVAQLVAVFREVKRVLRKDATLWLNLGDSYSGSWARSDNPGGKGGLSKMQVANMGSYTVGEAVSRPVPRVCPNGYKPKDLCGIPWLVAFALRADGWYLRQDIIWAKPNPMPESVTDRCTKAHEYIFLLSKSATYFYNQEAIREPFIYPEREYRVFTENHKTKQLAKQGNRSTAGLHDGRTQYGDPDVGRNRRSVWSISTTPFSEAHFATFPPELIKPCILAGCPANGTVLDPFFGAGTTGLVSGALNCQCIGIELNAEYLEIAAKRLSQSVFQFSPEAETEPELQQSLLGPDEEKKRN